MLKSLNNLLLLHILYIKPYMIIQEFKHYFLAGGLKCHWGFWLLPKSFTAITLFGHIFFNRSKEELREYLESKYAKRTIVHETVHVLQAQTFKTQYLGFYIYYLYYWIKNLFKYKFNNDLAYRNIPFEKEAFDKDDVICEYTLNDINWKNYI